jgi:multiple sugar transport system permease protein
MQEETTARSAAEAKTARPPTPSRRRRINWTGVLLVAPAVLLVAAFTLYPFGYALYTSTQLSSPILEARFVGLQNYQDVITSSYFLDAAKNTLLFTAASVPVLMVLGVLVAVLLNESFFGNGFLRAGMLLPWAIPAAAAGVIWKWVFLDDSGALNASLYSLGITEDYVPWLTTPSLARLAVVVVFIWTQLPLVSILLLAALQAVPDDLYDAAAVDGASALGRFRHITLPGIRPMLVIVAVYEVLVALATFDLTYSLTGGGPGTATTLLTYFIWSETFNQLSFGQGAALAVVIALVSLAAIFVILRALPEDALLGEDR